MQIVNNDKIFSIEATEYQTSELNIIVFFSMFQLERAEGSIGNNSDKQVSHIPPHPPSFFLTLVSEN